MEPRTLQRRQAEIPLSQVDIGVRYRRDYGDVKELAEDIAKRGVIQPIAVIDKRFLKISPELADELDPNKQFLLAAGGRRTYASKAAKKETIPAYIFEHEVDERELRALELTENVKRKDFTGPEKSALTDELHRLMQEINGVAVSGGGVNAGKGHGVKDTANMMGVSVGKVSKDLKVAEMIREMPDLKKLPTVEAVEKAYNQRKADEHRATVAKQVLAKEATTDLEKKRKNIASRFILGSFFELAEKIPDKSMDFFEIDPPYAKDLVNLIGEDRGTARHYNEVEVDEGDDRSLEEVYHEFLKKTFNIAFAKMKDNAWGICWYAMNPWHHLVKQWLEEAGFFVRGVPALWIKNHGRTRNMNFCLPDCYENFFYFRKGTPHLVKKGARNWFNHPVPPPSKRTHPAERPIELYMDIAQVFLHMGARTCSPFGGSGNWILACENMHINAVAFEISPQYKSDFDFKVHQSEPGKYRTFDASIPISQLTIVQTGKEE